MQRHLDEELQTLRQQLLDSGNLCQSMIRVSTKALLEHDLRHVSEIMAWEDQINRAHVEIDDRCMRLLASQAPLASDLRTIIAALKINNDLERIADQACNISQNTLDLLKAPAFQPTEALARIADLASDMVREALGAFLGRDLKLADEVLAKEIKVDALKREIFEEQIEEMAVRPSAIRRGLDLILIARNLEKIGDHATNIAEDVIFMVKGKDIRHHLGSAS